jgi:tetratricopeptide (TPR) repeat protein
MLAATPPPSLRPGASTAPRRGTDGARLEVLERLAGCAELAGDPAEAGTIWREVADGRRREGDPFPLGTAQRRLAAVLELQGRWQEALASREQAAGAFTAAGLGAEAAAAERLASAAHLRSAGSFRAALSLLETAGRQARAAGRIDLQARILGQEGNVRARMGEGQDEIELVRAGLAMALEHGLTGPAAEIYQRWPTPSSTPATTRRPRRPTTRRSASARPTLGSPRPGCAWAA